MTKLDQLPSELVSLIVSYVSNKNLPSCALINKSFYREAMPLLWHTIDIDSKESLIAFTTCLLQSPHAPGHHVRSLSITSMYKDTDILEQVQDVPYLDSLDIQHIPRYCPHLTSLQITCGCNPESVAYQIVQNMIASAGLYCKQLTKLVLHNCVYSDYDDLFDALKDAPLTFICLTLPDALDPQVTQRFLETAPLALHRYQQLTTLSIKVNKDATGFITTINTHGLTWPHLTDFDLLWCRSLTDAMALTFVQTNPTIEDLCLDYSGITDVFLDGLVDALPNLTTLHVESNPAITAAGICRLITNYGGLEGGVMCEACRISPEDIPKDKSYYGYQLLLGDEDAPEVEYFDGTFH